MAHLKRTECKKLKSKKCSKSLLKLKLVKSKELHAKLNADNVLCGIKKDIQTIENLYSKGVFDEQKMRINFDLFKNEIIRYKQNNEVNDVVFWKAVEKVDLGSIPFTELANIERSALELNNSKNIKMKQCPSPYSSNSSKTMTPITASFSLNSSFDKSVFLDCSMPKIFTHRSEKAHKMDRVEKVDKVHKELCALCFDKFTEQHKENSDIDRCRFCGIYVHEDCLSFNKQKRRCIPLKMHRSTINAIMKPNRKVPRPTLESLANKNIDLPPNVPEVMLALMHHVMWAIVVTKQGPTEQLQPPYVPAHVNKGVATSLFWDLAQGSLHQLALHHSTNPAAACSLLLHLLHSLGEPLLSGTNVSILAPVSKGHNQKINDDAVFAALDRLPDWDRETLAHFMLHLKIVVKEHQLLRVADTVICALVGLESASTITKTQKDVFYTLWQLDPANFFRHSIEHGDFFSSFLETALKINL